jgi:vanillate O-demethylase monooxygenase subunit
MEKPDRDYPLNQWYAAAFAGEVARQPLARTICDQQVVLFRTQAGVATALVDRCPHRKAPLSAGQLVGDNIECPFHGMQFAPDGACTRIPSQESIPPAAHIRSFPLVERHGHLWIWMGGQTADPALIPDMHWLTDPAVTAVKGSLALKCNYLLALDNLIDDTHLSFVHRRSIGTPKIAQAPMTVEGGDDWVQFTRWTLDTPPSAFHARAGGFTANVDRWFVSRFVKPATVLIDVGSAPVGTARSGDRSKGINIFSNHTVTPATATTCHYFWHAARNFGLGDEKLSQQIHADMHATFIEDQDIVEVVQRNQDVDPVGLPFLNLAGDAVCLRARRIIANLVAAELARGSSRVA